MKKNSDRKTLKLNPSASNLNDHKNGEKHVLTENGFFKKKGLQLNN